MNGSILIPEKFKLKGHVVTVVIDDSYCNEKDYLGEANFRERVIRLCDIYDGKKMKKSDKEKTFFHELIHMVLASMGKCRLYYNEDFVDEFANLLYEYEKTKQ